MSAVYEAVSSSIYFEESIMPNITDPTAPAPETLQYPVYLSAPSGDGVGATFSTAEEFTRFLASFDPDLDIRREFVYGSESLYLERAFTVTNEDQINGGVAAIESGFQQHGVSMLDAIRAEQGEVIFVVGNRQFTFEAGADLITAIAGPGITDTYNIFPEDIVHMTDENGNVYYTLANINDVSVVQDPTSAPYTAAELGRDLFADFEANPVQYGITVVGDYAPIEAGTGQSTGTDTDTVLVDGESVVVCPQAAEALKVAIENLGAAFKAGGVPAVIEALKDGEIVAPGAGGCSETRSSQVAA